MKYLSICSGIEAATVAWHHMGWKPVGFSEIEKFPSQVLAHHYPNVTNFGDMTKYKDWNLNDTVELLVGGTPCQSFSVAGLRKGLADPRGNLALVYLGLADHFKPRWIVWENVPGVLSSNGGRDFGSFLGALAELGYGFAYRVLDAQYFGVAQRRRRVFVVGYLGDWRRAAAVLFDSESLRGNPAPSRETRKEIAGSSGASTSKRSWPAEVSSTLDTTFGTKQGLEDQHVNAGCPLFVPDTVQTLRAKRPGEGGMSNDDEHIVPVVSPALNTCSGANHAPDTKAYVVQPIAFHVNAMPDQMNFSNETSASLTCSQNSGIAQEMKVRRLTPTECERLQGFPDGYTDIKPNGKQTPDGPRYKALGNSMAVPVMRWIGERIQMVEDL